MELERENGGIGELAPRRIRAQSSGRSDRYFHVDASGTFFFFFHISFHIPPSQARRPCVSVLTVRMCLCFTSLAADLDPRDFGPRATSQEKGRPAG